jgi:excisionase family DNA binding protein
MSDEQFPMTLEEVANRLRVSERTVLRLLETKELKGYKVRRAWRIEPADLADYIRRQKEAAADDDGGQSDSSLPPAA